MRGCLRRHRRGPSRRRITHAEVVMGFGIARRLVAGLAALGLGTVAAMAQGPPGPPFGPGGGGPGGPSLIAATAVQKELGLTDKQKSQIKKLDASIGQKRRQASDKAQ